MDKPLTKTNWQRLHRPLVITAVLLAVISLWSYAIPGGGKNLSLAQANLDIAKVASGEFEDFIPLRGQIMPLRTIYLDSIEGGRVEKIHLEDGADVDEGQAIVDISNSNLQLSSFTLETQVSEQLNNMQSQELHLAQNQLAQKREQNELDYQIQLTENKLQRLKPLIKAGNVRLSDVSDSESELAYLKRKHQLLREAAQTDQALQQSQMKAMRESVQHLQANLNFAKQNLDKLNVKSPMKGKLTAFSLELGQSIKPGERFGQIDDPHHIKLVAFVDEFYMPRLFVGQQADVNFQQQHYALNIKKIYPQVSNGQFQIDLIFSGESPAGVRRGQSMQAHLQLSENSKVLMIPNGSFYQDTGGKWIFVLTPDGRQAIKRNIRLGRRNMHSIEVLEGLKAGERVVTSAYAGYLDIDKLTLQTHQQ